MTMSDSQLNRGRDIITNLLSGSDTRGTPCQLGYLDDVLQAAKDEGCRNVLLGSDCHCCMAAINNKKSTLPSELKYFVEEIQEICSSFDSCICLWIDKGSNNA